MSASAKFQSLRRLTCFAAIAEAGSIRGGARQLGLSVPVVSTALAELEEELGLVLAVRTTRSLTLTAEGQRVFANAQDMLNAAEEALDLTNEHRKPSGQLTITLPVELGSNWLPERLHRFLIEYPDIELSINTNDMVVPLERSQYDISIQANYRSPHSTYKKPSKLRNNPDYLGKVELICITKSKVRCHWNGDIANLDIPLIQQLGRPGKLTAMRKKDNQMVSIFGNKLITINNHESALAMAVTGLGAVQVMADSAQHYVRSKSLVRLLPNYSFGHLDLELKMRDRLPSPQAKAFRRFLLNYSDN